MKKIFFSILLSTYSIINYAQYKDSISLKELEIPTSPGFILLDNAPTLIERPTSSRAFAFSILNSIDNSNGIPNNYAIEVTPFWYFKNKNMTSYKYIGYNSEKGKQSPFAQAKKMTINFSYKGLADTIVLTPNHNFAIGTRTTLIQILTAKNIEAIKAANDKCIYDFRKIDEELIKAGITMPIPGDSSSNYSLEEYFKKREQFINTMIPLLKEQDKVNLKDLLAQKPLFAIDWAAGYNFNFIDNRFSQHQFGRFGTWLTMSLAQSLSKEKNPPTSYFNFYATGRFIIDELAKTSYLDAGGKAELELEKLSIGYEFIYRLNEISNTYRSNGIAKYKVSPNVYLTAAFGKNFGDTNDLISVLGLNWGVSTGKEKASIKE